MPIYKILLALILTLCHQDQAFGTDYYVHPEYGRDTHSGQSRQQAFKTLKRASQVLFLPGDRLLLASGEVYPGGLSLAGQHGRPARPITVTTIGWDKGEDLPPALIDFKGEPNGILLEGCSFIRISNLRLTGDGSQQDPEVDYHMRCGVLISNKGNRKAGNITLKELHIFDVFFENEGFTRGEGEVRTPNGTQRYGWGIRVINDDPDAPMDSIRIENCLVENVSHTGIKLTGQAKNIRHISIAGNEARKTGGPGIQMSEVRNAHVVHNMVSHSGSEDDSRKWGRGSGFWAWGSSRILIEKNSFLHANGPGDSAGAHIDFNCDHIILQYNLSAYNAGGFCEVLGNTYNCAYRYNVSINDGYRRKGVDGAFQEGKSLWLSGYQGRSRKRKGPVNFYFYNNTIYCDSSLVSRIAIDNTSKGILIANNIFHLEGGAKAVLGDQYKPDTKNGGLAENVIFRNNLFLNKAGWPAGMGIKDTAPLFGDPDFENEGGSRIEDYVPANVNLIRNKGIKIRSLPGDRLGLWKPLQLEHDILGNPTNGKAGIGAIESYK